METFREFYHKRTNSRLNKTKRDRFINYWRSLLPNAPIFLQPIPKDHVGDSYNQDVVRITGTPEFISSVIGRIKDFILFDNDRSRLEISYRRVSKPREDGTWAYSLYIKAKER